MENPLDSGSGASLQSEQPGSAEIRAFWDGRYSGADRVWSGRPNEALVSAVKELTPGSALELGCGEGADALWLALRGWKVTGVDISSVATARAAEAAIAAGLQQESTRFVAADLSSWDSDESFDLVASSFLHFPAGISRTAVLRRFAERVSPGGHFLSVSHAAPPPWAKSNGRGPHLASSPEEELAGLELDLSRWAVERLGTFPREAVGPNGETAVLSDSVLLLRNLQS